MRFGEAQFEIEKDDGVTQETNFQTLESLQYMIAVQKDHIKAAWHPARQRYSLVKMRIRRLDPEAGQDHSFLLKRNNTN